MNKIVVRRPGGFSALKLQSAPHPIPGPNEVRVATRAIGVNYADCVVRLGLYPSAREYVGWPITPGFEFAGIVEAVGSDVSDLELGARVLGVTRFGAYASHVVVPREQLFAIPERLTFEQAGSLPVAFLTAWYALIELGAVSAGANVLVHSAAGGVGSALCQLARYRGARTLGVVGSAHKVDHARAQGADAVVDKSREALWPAAHAFAPRGFDVVLDANGADTLKRSYRSLAPMGRLVVYGFHTMMSHGGIPNPFKLFVQYMRTPRFDPMEMVNRNVAVFAFNLSYLFERIDMYQRVMQSLLSAFANGELTPLPIQTFALADAPSAHRQLQSGRTLGKLVLVP